MSNCGYSHHGGPIVKVCDIPPFEWMTDCGSSGGTGSTTAGSVSQPCLQTDKIDPSMPEPGAALLFGSALVALVLFKKLRP